MLLGGQFSSRTLGSPYSGSLFSSLKSGGQSTAELQGEPSEVCRGSKFAACRPGLLPRADDTSAAPVIPHVTTIESDPGVSPSFLISGLHSLFLISFPLCKLHRQLVKNSICSYRSSIASSGFCAYPVRSPVHNTFSFFLRKPRAPYVSPSQCAAGAFRPQAQKERFQYFTMKRSVYHGFFKIPYLPVFFKL